MVDAFLNGGRDSHSAASRLYQGIDVLARSVAAVLLVPMQRL